jgi:hypothetical protein
MTVYSFYIFDRHTECIYSKHWLPQSTPSSLPASSSSTNPDAAPHPPPSSHGHQQQSQLQQLQSQQPHHQQGTQPTAATRTRRPPSADDAKLIFGAVFSLRSMVRKLGGTEDAFVSYSTAEYKLHYFETASNLRFVLLTDPNTQSMRSVLHQIYVSLWVEHVVKNPLAPVEHKGGEGVRSELFEQVLDRFLGTLGYA